MSARRDALERIAAALERLAPASRPPIDWYAYPAYLWGSDGARGVETIETVGLNRLRGIEEQASALTTNLERLAQGAAAHDMLLWGARGMGKSALVRAGVEQVQANHPDRLALLQVAPGGLASLPELIAALTGASRAFVLFLDDLGFDAGDLQGNLALRSLLDGGVLARPANIRLAVTSNRRAITIRSIAEDEARHARDERDDALALADRFGLTLSFHPCDQDTYLAILRGYTEPVGLDFREEEALAWARARGNRSGRTAYQFACELAGRAGKML